MGLGQVAIVAFVLQVSVPPLLWHTNFRTQVVLVHEVFQSQVSSGVDRLVFFSVDGLQASSFFERPNVTAHLTAVLAEGRGVSGISHTQDETVTIPAHRALLAGIREDPSSLCPRLQYEYRTLFDTVFNRTSHGVILGASILTDMIVKVTHPEGKKSLQSFGYDLNFPKSPYYTRQFRDFDFYIFHKFQELLRANKLDRGNKSLVLLHLTRMDVLGHNAKPHSELYFKDLSTLDRIVSQVEKLLREYYGNERTVFIFTSDHGMTNDGHHGRRTEDETECPFVVWGEGIKGGKNERFQLLQTDFAALIAGTLSIGFPTNSRGRFPSAFFRNQTLAYHALSANLKQLRELSRVKRSVVWAAVGITWMLHVNPEDRVEHLQEEARDLAEGSDFQNASIRLHEAISITQTQIDYYEGYERNFLLVCTVSSPLLFMLFLILVILSEGADRARVWFGRYHLLDFLISLYITKGIFDWPLYRLPYFFSPLSFLRLLFHKVRQINSVRNCGSVKLVSGSVLLCLIGAEILLFAHCKFEALSLALLLTGGWVSWASFKRSSGRVMCQWWISIIVLAIFPSLPNFMDTESPAMMTLGPLISGTLSLIWLIRWNSLSLSVRERRILCFQVFLLMSSSTWIQLPRSHLRLFLSWSSLVLTLLPLLIPSRRTRLFSLFLALSIPFGLLSRRQEAFFLLPLFAVIRLFIGLEMGEDSRVTYRGSERPENKGIANDLRRAWCHFLFATVCYFGVQDFQGAEEFLFESYDLYTKFFLHGPVSDLLTFFLFIVKVACPFVIMSSLFGFLQRSGNGSPRERLIFLVLCQALPLPAIYNVNAKTMERENLEIQQSIQIFIILHAFGFWLWVSTVSTQLYAITKKAVRG